MASSYKDLTTHLKLHPCIHTDPSEHHPNITSLTLTLHLRQDTAIDHRIGIIQADLLTTSSLNSNFDFWTECRAFDRAHSPTAKLNKVENYLSNESFYEDKQVVIDRAGWVLYVEIVYLGLEWRGRGWGLIGVERLIGEVERMWKENGMGEGVVVLEPGPVRVREEWDLDVRDDEEVEGRGDATEKLARHWKRMGFETWSYTDEAWLCLSTARRPGIWEIVERLEGEEDGHDG